MGRVGGCKYMRNIFIAIKLQLFSHRLYQMHFIIGLDSFSDKSLIYLAPFG